MVSRNPLFSGKCLCYKVFKIFLHEILYTYFRREKFRREPDTVSGHWHTFLDRVKRPRELIIFDWNESRDEQGSSTSLTVESIAKALPVDLGLPLCRESFYPWTSGSKRTRQEICFLLLLIYGNWIRRIRGSKNPWKTYNRRHISRLELQFHEFHTFSAYHHRLIAILIYLCLDWINYYIIYNLRSYLHC